MKRKCDYCDTILTVERPKDPPPHIVIYGKRTVSVKCTNPQCGRINMVDFDGKLS